MRTITLMPYDGKPGTHQHAASFIYGELPEGWGEVQLAHYAQLASAADVEERIRATALICGLPAEPLLYNTGCYGSIVNAAPWLFNGPLPDAVPAERSITHLGLLYEHVGDLHRINAGQLEALLDFLNQHKRAPLLAAPALLAVLYCPAGEKQTADVVEATAEAFATLPVSIGWPVLMDFLRSGAPAEPQKPHYLFLRHESANYCR